MTTKKRLSETAFLAAIQPMQRLSQQSIQIAREIMVHGKKQTEVARAYQLSVGVVSNLVNRIYRAAQQPEQSIPKGFQRIELVLPDKLVPVARTLEKVGKSDWPDES